MSMGALLPLYRAVGKNGTPNIRRAPDEVNISFLHDTLREKSTILRLINILIAAKNIKNIFTCREYRAIIALVVNILIEK